VPELTVAAALTLGAIVAPPDAVSAAAIGRRLGLPRQIMTLLGGESLLNDATALTAYKVALAAAIGTASTWGTPVFTFALAAVGGTVIGAAMGSLIVFVRTWLGDSLVESAIGLMAPFFIYLLAEEAHGSGVIAVVVAALILGQRSSRAGYATRLQDTALWKTLQFVLESFAFLLIGLQLPTVVAELRGISASVLAIASVSVLATVIVVRIVWVFVMAYVPRKFSRRIRDNVSTLSGDPFPGRPQLVFLTFVVVIGTLLLHGLTLPWIIKVLDVQGDDVQKDALEQAAAQTKAAQAAADRLDELMALQRPARR
jgi:NhaP-type Na+/H+ or K+/H+ antiporter